MLFQTKAFPSTIIATTSLVRFSQILPWILPLLLFSSRAVADFTVLIIGLIFILKSSVERDWAWLQQPWFKASLLFWVYLLTVNATLSVQPLNSFIYSLFFIRWPLFAAAIAFWLLNNTQQQRQFLIVLIAVITFIVFDTWWQYFFDKDLFGHLKVSAERLTGPFTKPIPGIMLLRVLFIALFAGLLFARLSAPFRWVLFTMIALSLGLMTLFITGERMALLLCLSGALVIVVGLWFEYAKLRVIIAVSILLSVALLLLTIFLAPEMANRSIYSLLFKLQNFTDSDYGKVFSAAWQAWQQNFVFGSGFHTYKTVCEQLGLLAGKGMSCTHPHNLYLQIGAETGVVGLILFTYLILNIYHAALQPLIKARAWYVSALAFVVLSVCFWPLIGGISVLNNWVAAFVWLGVGWVIAISLKYSSGQYKANI